MKLQISYLIVLIFCLTSCSDFLDRPPLDQLSEDTFYKTESDINSALLGAYSSLQNIDWTGKGWMMLEVPSDNSQAGGTDPEFSPIDNFTLNGDTPPVGATWAIRYNLITYANVVISKVEESTFEQGIKDEFAAEGRFLRALAYFDLVRLFGPVPLITEPPTFDQDLLYPRTPLNDVYDAIKADLAFAGEHLPMQRNGADLGRATKGAALALLAKVHLTRKEYGLSRDRAKEVIDLGVYSLMENYGDNFELATGDNNQESIFEVQFKGCANFGTGNARQAFFAPWGEGITKDRDGWGSQIPTSPSVNPPGTTIGDAFEAGDLRKNHTLLSPNVHYPSINPSDGGYTYPGNGASASGINIKKYVVGSGTNICFMSTPLNASIIRYADVLLTYAESLMEIQGGETSNDEALYYFNLVRERAGLDPLLMINKEIVLHERRVEFAFENQRWFDLLRTGKAIEKLIFHGKSIQQHNLLFPIPSSELETNSNLTQNPGY